MSQAAARAARALRPLGVAEDQLNITVSSCLVRRLCRATHPANHRRVRQPSQRSIYSSPGSSVKCICLLDSKRECVQWRTLWRLRGQPRKLYRRRGTCGVMGGTRPARDRRSSRASPRAAGRAPRASPRARGPGRVRSDTGARRSRRAPRRARSRRSPGGGPAVSAPAPAPSRCGPGGGGGAAQ